MAEWFTAERLCIRITETDRIDHQNLAERLVQEAHRHGLSGASVSRGFMSWGPGAHFHTSHVLDLGNDLPVCVELVDRSEQIESFVPLLTELLERAGCGALVTRDCLDAIQFRRQK